MKIDVATQTAKTKFLFEIEICSLMKMIFAPSDVGKKKSKFFNVHGSMHHSNYSDIYIYIYIYIYI